MGQKKIIWAFDPYTDIVETWKRTEETVNCLNVNDGFEVEPVYVLGSDLLKWVGNVTPPQIEHIRPFVDKTLQERISALKIKHLKAPEVIESMNTSRRQDVKSLVEYVNNQKPNLLVLNTHAREGVKRFFMGSFAENILLQCKSPILYINPSIEPVQSMKSALFPTDFSDHSFGVFKKFIKELDGVLKSVTVFSKVLRPINAFAEAGVTALGGAWVAPEQYIEQEKKFRSEDSDKWLQYAKEQGLECDLIIDDSLGDVVDSVGIYEKDVDFVAMSSESGPMESVVVGSIARSVIRNSNKPVMVCHY